MGSDFQDTGHWSTGNAWAAAGMLRVLATISGSQYSHLMKNEMKDLKNWVNEIHDGMYAHIVRRLLSLLLTSVLRSSL